MIVVRPVQSSDIDQLYKLAKKVAPGITTFPPNANILARKIEDSIIGFSEDPSDQKQSSYLMVMVNDETGMIMGTAGVYANIGKEIPFYTFDILARTQFSYELNARVTSRTLHLVNEYVGDTEIGTLILDPGYRGEGHGKLLSKCRYMLIAQFRERFSERIFAELRGWSDSHSVSPFWESVGKHFFDNLSYERADYLSATTNNQFIADLMPVYPIYIDLLPKDVQDVIGQPHPTGEPALKMLFNEGFRYENFVDIFDAGPTVHGQKSDIVTIKNSKLYRLIDNSLDGSGRECLIANTMLKDFRVCQAQVEFEGNGVRLSSETSTALNSNIGDQIRIIPLNQ
jgi:arginine N-succinyltransferase